MTKAMEKLRAHPLVDEVENEGMDEGRWMVGLKDGYGIGSGYDRTHAFSCGGAVEGLARMKDVTADAALRAA